MYIDAVTRQIFNYATPISCINNAQNSNALDPDTDERYVLTPKPVLRATQILFEPKQVQSADSPISFTAKETGIHWNAELTHFWNRILFTRHYDTTLKLLGICFSAFRFVQHDFTLLLKIHKAISVE